MEQETQFPPSLAHKGSKHKMLWYYSLIALILQQSYLVNSQSQACTVLQECGDVILEYPFNLVSKNCPVQTDDYFRVTCDNSSSNHKPKAVLTKLDLEVIAVLLPHLIVKIPVARVCGGVHNGISSLNLSGSPFFIDTEKNVFASVGCDGNASLYNEEGDRVGGCGSRCNPPHQVIDGCSGYYCCQSNLRSITSFQRYTLQVTTGRRSGGDCRAGFLSSRTFLQTNMSVAAAMGDSATVPVVLFWVKNDSQSGQTGGITLIASCSCFGCFWFWKSRKRRKEARLRAKYFKKRLKEEQSSNMEVVEKTKLFPLKVLKNATNNFNVDRILGQGGQGTVYKGMLNNGQVIAVKKSKAFDEKQWKEFINEIILLSKINHRNVVKLLGCCLETKAPTLVYEFIPNGTLSEHIHNSKQVLISWEMRKKIACEVAGAISYLHSSLSAPIYHRDIKSVNILLDEHFRAKVADFGISKVMPLDQTHMTTCVQGTFGYLDPEYFRSGHFSEKSDVYSFGVVLVELLTGQSSIRDTNIEGEKSLVVYFISSTLDEILDPVVLGGSDVVIEEAKIVADLARRCLRPRGVERPTMKEVAMELERLRKPSSVSYTKQPTTSLEIENVAIGSVVGMGNANTTTVLYNNMNIAVEDGNDEQPLRKLTW